MLKKLNHRHLFVNIVYNINVKKIIAQEIRNHAIFVERILDIFMFNYNVRYDETIKLRMFLTYF